MRNFNSVANVRLAPILAPFFFWMTHFPIRYDLYDTTDLELEFVTPGSSA